MKNSLTTLVAIASLAVAVAASASPAQAQALDNGGIVTRIATMVPTNTPYDLMSYTYPALRMGCQLRREQFSDDYGWRVRVVSVCPASLFR